MSDPRYRAGVLQGIKLNSLPGEWPGSIGSLGAFRGGQPLARCHHCGPAAHPAVAMTFVRYGETPLCKRHALGLAK